MNFDLQSAVIVILVPLDAVQIIVLDMVTRVLSQQLCCWSQML